MKNLKKLCVGLLSLGTLVGFAATGQAQSYSSLHMDNAYSYGYVYQVVHYVESDPYPYYPYFPSAPKVDKKSPYGVNPFHPLVNRHLRRSPTYHSVYMY